MLIFINFFLLQIKLKNLCSMKCLCELLKAYNFANESSVDFKLQFGIFKQLHFLEAISWLT